jgi:hypothetical protein
VLGEHLRQKRRDFCRSLSSRETAQERAYEAFVLIRDVLTDV